MVHDILRIEFRLFCYPLACHLLTIQPVFGLFIYLEMLPNLEYFIDVSVQAVEMLWVCGHIPLRDLGLDELRPNEPHSEQGHPVLVIFIRVLGVQLLALFGDANPLVLVKYRCDYSVLHLLFEVGQKGKVLSQ